MKRKIKDPINDALDELYGVTKTFKDVEPVSFYKLTAGALAGAMLLSHGFIIKLLGVALFLYILYVENKE